MCKPTSLSKIVLEKLLILLRICIKFQILRPLSVEDKETMSEASH